MIRNGELKYVTKNMIEVGMYNPKSGSDSDIIVVNFYIKEESALPKLQDFIEYIPLKTFISVSTSNYMDEDGYYTVFIELEKTKELFKDFIYVVKEISNLTSFNEWYIKTYKHEARKYKLEDLKNAI
jgi:hypothetical protein